MGCLGSQAERNYWFVKRNVLSDEENQHLAPFEITVLPEYRRQGLGRRFLEVIADVTQVENRRLLVTNTVDRVPSGEAFMTRIGGRKGLEAHTNQLRIADLDRGLIANWLRRGER